MLHVCIHVYVARQYSNATDIFVQDWEAQFSWICFQLTAAGQLGMVLLLVALCLLRANADSGAGGAWDRVGPHNIFDAYKDGGQGPLPMGEAGTLAGASSLASAPHIIYAGGQNNGVSSGIIKTTDGGQQWERKSNGIWDTRILGVWVQPDDPTGNHVFTGTHSGIYETTDGAEHWKLREETAQWGNVMSFREATIQGKEYIVVNTGNGLGTMPRAGGTWQFIKAPGGIAPNAHLSVVINPNKETEGCSHALAAGVAASSTTLC